MRTVVSSIHPRIAIALLVACVAAAGGARADEAPLTRLEVFPATIKLAGPRSRAQVVVTGHYADGTIRDLTQECQIASAKAATATVERTIVLPKQDGKTQLTISVEGKTTTVPVEVAGFSAEQPVSFEFEMLAALSKQGCNSGACHGSPSGKGGFRLSLRAFDTVLDRQTVIREDLGRRTNPVDADASLLLAKPMMRLPHGGGLKLTKRDPAYSILRQWIAEGCRPDADDAARCLRIEVSPRTGRLLKFPHTTRSMSSTMVASPPATGRSTLMVRGVRV